MKLRIFDSADERLSYSSLLEKSFCFPGCRDIDITEIDITESDVTENDITENDITESDITESDIT